LKPINFKTQFDDNFLLPPISSGEVAKQINQYVNLDIIDTSLANINSTVRDLTKKVEENKETLKLLQEEIEAKYSNLDKAEQQLVFLEKINKRWVEITAGAKRLDELIAIGDDVKGKLKEYKNLSVKHSELMKLCDLFDENTQLNKDKDKLGKIIEKSNYVTNTLKRCANVKEKSKDLERIRVLEESRKECRDDSQRLTFLYNSISRIRKDIERIGGSIKEKENQIEKVLPKGSVCPFCGQVKK
jgi:DNA repair ATPase RecN